MTTVDAPTGRAARRAVAPVLAVTVALVLADSAVVTLALPDILRHLDASVGQVAWVLISFNLVLGLGAVPAARGVARAQPRIVSAAGIAVFAASSAWCALAGSIGVLIAARCLEAVGGAVALVGCLELLVAEHGERRGIAAWVTAGVVGTATGPVAGGLLTQALAWQAIFVVQVPLAVLAVPAALAARTAPVPEPGSTDSRLLRATIRARWRRRRRSMVQPDRRRDGSLPSHPPGDARDGANRRIRAQPYQHRPAIRANLTLALLSAALTAALFLLVLLLVDGWRRSPATAALTVSVVPLAAVAARPLARILRAPPDVEVAAGCLLVAGGLVGLAIPPSADLAWTVAPQALVGLGLGLTVDRLTSQAIHMRLPRPQHAGWTIGARHLGVVAGLAILTPVFTADLRDAQAPAQEAIVSLVLDAPLTPQDKIAVAGALGSALTDQHGQIPDLHRAFATVHLDAGERPAATRLERDLDGQLERAATRAFRDSFLVGAGIALLALLTVIAPRRRRIP